MGTKVKTNDLILKTVTKVVAFIIIIYSWHLFFAGHYTPGGGFIGGLMSASAIVLMLFAFGLKTVANAMPFNFLHVAVGGLLLSVLSGLGALIFQVPFLTQTFGYVDLPILGETALATTVIFDLGVYLVVVGVAMTIIQTIGESD